MIWRWPIRWPWRMASCGKKLRQRPLMRLQSVPVVLRRSVFQPLLLIEGPCSKKKPMNWQVGLNTGRISEQATSTGTVSSEVQRRTLQMVWNPIQSNGFPQVCFLRLKHHDGNTRFDLHRLARAIALSPDAHRRASFPSPRYVHPLPRAHTAHR